MRVLQIVHGFPPYEWAGTELITCYLAQALQARGHEVSVFARVGDPAAAEGAVREESFAGLKVFRVVNNYRRLSSFFLKYDNPFLNKSFLRLLEHMQPDVVHFQHTLYLSISLIRLASALGYPTILSLHDFFFVCHLIHLIDSEGRLCPGPERGERCVLCLRESASAEEVRRRFLLMEHVLRQPQLILTPSVFLAEKMQGYFPFLQERVRVVPLGVKRVPGMTRERPLRTSANPLRVLYIGVLAPHKGAHVLIKALKGLPPDAIEVSVYGLVSSDWQLYAERLQAEAKELPVRFHDSYVHDQLGAILMRHDVLVMPMIWEETFSLLTREAFLAGLPVVAVRRGALPEAVQDGINGLLFEPENAADLQHCLRRLIAEPELFDRLCKTDPQVKTIEEYAQEIEAIYGEVVRGIAATKKREERER